MIKISPFTYEHLHFENGVKHFSPCLKLGQELVFKENGLILITGKSGSGKSTFLSIMKGLIPFHINGKFDGKVWIEDQLLTNDNINSFNQKIIYLFQNPFSQIIHQDPSLELAFTMENMNYPPSLYEEKRKEIELKFGLSDRLNNRTNLLSNGECQKLVLGSLIALSPKILLLDEPTAFLDPKARKNFYEILAELKKDHLVFIVDHHVEEVKNITDQFLIIENGDVKLDKVLTPTEVDTNAGVILNYKKEKAEIQLTIRDLNFSYDKKRYVLKNVNLSATGGECVVIKGENGQGKSTLFKLMAGVIPSKRNVELLINGQKISNKNLLKHVGFVFQNPESNFFFNTLEEEIDAENKDELLKIFFNEKDYKRSPFLFSEGQKRRISILINLALDKKVIFLDEPTFGQDYENKKNIATIVKSLKDLGVLVFVISHDEEFISNISDRVYVLNNGELNEVR